MLFDLMFYYMWECVIKGSRPEGNMCKDIKGEAMRTRRTRLIKVAFYEGNVAFHAYFSILQAEVFALRVYFICVANTKI